MSHSLSAARPLGRHTSRRQQLEHETALRTGFSRSIGFTSICSAPVATAAGIRLDWRTSTAAKLMRDPFLFVGFVGREDFGDAFELGGLVEEVLGAGVDA